MVPRGGDESGTARPPSARVRGPAGPRPGSRRKPLPSSCADASTSVEPATSEATEYSFGAPGHVVAAEGVYWLGIPGEVLTLPGAEPGCWTGGVVVGVYDDTSVYECDPLHCPIEGCPEPCFAYHSATCLAPESAAGQVIEGFECAQYGDGISREASSGDLVIRNAHLHDLNDDAVEDDYGLSDTRVFGSLIDGVHTAFGDRQRAHPGQRRDGNGVGGARVPDPRATEREPVQAQARAWRLLEGRRQSRPSAPLPDHEQRLRRPGSQASRSPVPRGRVRRRVCGQHGAVGGPDHRQWRLGGSARRSERSCGRPLGRCAPGGPERSVPRLLPRRAQARSAARGGVPRQPPGRAGRKIVESARRGMGEREPGARRRDHGARATARR